MSGTVVKVSGSLVVAEGLAEANMADLVRIGEARLPGEILHMAGDTASIQVYEGTDSLGPGAEVISSGEPLSVELGPGLLGNIYDGMQRPLEELYALGDTIAKGVDIPALKREKKWNFHPTVTIGDSVSPGDSIGTVQETAGLVHKIMIPPGLSGSIAEIHMGERTVDEVVAVVKGKDGTAHNVKMMQRWPARAARPYRQKYMPGVPIQTGQPLIDSLFPLAKGGSAAVSGPNGAGKTTLLNALAKHADVDLLVYVGCGERGREMTELFTALARQTDSKSGEPLIKRSVLIANSADMPLAAREAAVCTGLAIAEYFRDMGYDVAFITDSISRWAEALREMSGRLEELPGDEGYPAYLGSRLAQFYGRAGVVQCLGSDGRRGSLAVIGALSPPGGDTSDPVRQAALRVVRAFWELNAAPAHGRHFPAVNWQLSYSFYIDSLAPWYEGNRGKSFMENRAQALEILQEEASLLEIAGFMGRDSLSPEKQSMLEAAEMLREAFFRQNTFAASGNYTPIDLGEILGGLQS